MAKKSGTKVGGSGMSLGHKAEDPIYAFVRGEEMRRGNQPGPKAGKAVNKKTVHSGATGGPAHSKGAVMRVKGPGKGGKGKATKGSVGS